MFYRTVAKSAFAVIICQTCHQATGRVILTAKNGLWTQSADAKFYSEQHYYTNTEFPLTTLPAADGRRFG